MKRFLKSAIVVLGLGLGGTSQAAPKPIKVWLYGDGQSTRMYSELKFLLPGTNITVLSGAVNSTGPEGLASTIQLHFLANPNALPDVVHIGYSASASSYLNCASPNGQTNPTAFALQEAVAIRDAANAVTSAGKKVLLTKGTGFPTYHAISPCMNAATNAVTWNLAILAPQHPWVDYSGNTAGAAAPVQNALKLDPMNPFLWQSDGVHVSCDKAHFLPGDPYSDAFCLTITTQAQREALLGSWRVAKTVLKAYKFFQN
jgi:hypothetical protein